MRIEVDISNPDMLHTMRAELKRLINIVDFGIAQLDKAPPPLPPTKKAAVDSAIQSMPLKFTTSDIVIALGKDYRTSIKFGLRWAVASGKLKIIEHGRGRKPNTYKKLFH